MRPRQPNGRQPNGNEVVRYWSGPLPDPETIRAYEEAVKGSGNIILDSFKSQSKHRRKMEKKSVNQETGLQGLAMGLGFLINMTIIVGGLFLLYKGKSIAGFATLIIVPAQKWYIETRKNNKK